MTQLSDLIDQDSYNKDILKLMIGKLVYDVQVSPTEDEILFIFNNCEVLFYHSQSCCELVIVEDVIGDWKNIIGQMLIVAEERENDEPESDEEQWTFYTFRTIQGTVDVRWHGTSNGYYSMSVNMSVKGKSRTR